MSDGDIPWDGAPCPERGGDLVPEPLALEGGVAVAYVCAEHGTVRLESDPFGNQAEPG